MKPTPRRRRAAAHGESPAPDTASTAEVMRSAREELEARGVRSQAVRFGELIHEVSRLRQTVFDQLMRPHQFTRARWWVLAALLGKDGMTQSQLAAVLELGKPALGALLEQLDADGWIERRADPRDRRTRRVYLRASAYPVISRLMSQEDELNRKTLAPLTAGDLDTLIRLLSQVKESMTALRSCSGLLHDPASR